MFWRRFQAISRAGRHRLVDVYVGLRTAKLLRQLLQQRLRLFQIARVEPFGEPPVNRSKQFARLRHLALVATIGVRGSWRRGVCRTWLVVGGRPGAIKARFCLFRIRTVTALPLMWSEIGPQFTLACKMPGEIVVASKCSALKETPAAFDKVPATARPLNGGISPANPTAVGLLFKANERCTCHATPS
jgi:hypothetical protein